MIYGGVEELLLFFSIFCAPELRIKRVVSKVTFLLLVTVVPLSPTFPGGAAQPPFFLAQIGGHSALLRIGIQENGSSPWSAVTKKSKKKLITMAGPGDDIFRSLQKITHYYGGSR